MATYIIRRTLAVIPVLIVVSIITFFLMHLAPGGPFDTESSKRQDPRMLAILQSHYGLDKPLWEQYLIYMGGAVRLDLGPSLVLQKERNVTDILRDQFRYTAQLGVMALIFAMIIGLPLGVLAALRQNSWVDYVALTAATLGIAVPSFVLSIYLILLFAITLHMTDVAPTAEAYNTQFSAWILPTIALGLPNAAFLARLTRSAVVEVLRQDYVRTARAKGLQERVVILRHIIKNAMIPVWTVLGPLTAGLITGSFVVERIFGVPGIGRFYIDSVTASDYSLIMATTLLYSILIVLFNLITDLTYGLFDPRVKVGQ